jgi:hypothetical protein
MDRAGDGVSRGISSGWPRFCGISGPPAFGGLVLPSILRLWPPLALRELRGLSDYPVRRLWVLLVLVVLIPGLQLG